MTWTSIPVLLRKVLGWVVRLRNKIKYRSSLSAEDLKPKPEVGCYLVTWSVGNNTITSSYREIVRVIVVLKRTVVGDWRFDNPSGSHLQSLTTDREQFTRSNAPTARLPTLVRLAETLTRDWLNTNEPRENGDANNHIAVHHQLTNHNIDWDSAQCLTYSTNYFQRHDSGKLVH